MKIYGRRRRGGHWWDLIGCGGARGVISDGGYKILINQIQILRMEEEPERAASPAGEASPGGAPEAPPEEEKEVPAEGADMEEVDGSIQQRQYTDDINV